MTLAKYLTLAKDPHQERIIALRGDKTGELLHYICGCDECDDDIQTIIGVQRRDLPHPMSPSEFDSFCESAPDLFTEPASALEAELGYE